MHKSKHSERIDDEILQVEELDDIPDRPRRLRPARHVGGRASARLLSLVGLGGIGVGLALATGTILPLPEGFHIPTLDQSGLLLAIAGLVVWSMSSVRRGQIALAQDDEDLVLLEQVAGDLVGMREALKRSQQEGVKARSDMRDLAQKMQALTEQQMQRNEEQPEEGEGNALEDGLFRLAASLDQLGARIEKRMHVHNLTLQDRLDEFSQTMIATHQGVRDMLMDLHGHGPQAEYAEQAPAEEPYEEAQPQGGVEAAAEEPDPDAVYAEWSREQTDAAGRPAALATGSLGLLDQLDASGRKERAGAGQQQRPVAAPPTGNPPAAMPARRSPRGTWEEELEMVVSKQDGDADVDSKLHQLSQLLSDERLRNALEQMRRSAG